MRLGLLLLTLTLIAGIVPECGCSSEEATSAQDSNSSIATQDTEPQSQSTTPPTQAGASTSEAALAQAKAEGKQVLIKFGSGQCIPCKQIEENISQIKPEYEGRVAFIIVDVYNPLEDNLTTQYGIQTIPTTFFLGRDGSVVSKGVGVLEPDQMRQQLDALL